MSSIYKLSISGIRSFSDECQETIQFGKPLTLIVGTNGSGKTTIIECLRYATTGELPPNSKANASFINDPNLHSSNETKAQIKLAFQNTNKKNMILTKSLMAIKNPKSKNISFKTRENQLMIINNGEKITISSKMADIEKLLPDELGISKSILNYVIFCHQDESLWPISDSATLKKKFDEIFDSTKFIKILENIKLITKNANVDIKILTNNVDHLKNDKFKLVKKKDFIKELNSQIGSIKKNMSDLDIKISIDNKELNDLYNRNQNFERTISNMESLKQQEKNIEQNILRIQSTNEMLNKPEDELLKMLNNFANILADQRLKSDSLKVKINERCGSLENLRLKYNENLIKEGELKSLYDRNLQNKSKLDNIFLKFKDVLNISNKSELNSKLKFKINQLDNSHKKLKLSLQQELDNLKSNADATKDELNKETQHSEYITNDINNLKIKKTELDSRLISITTNQSKINKFKLDLKEKEDTLQENNSLNKLLEINKNIDHSKRELIKYELNLEDCQTKLQISRRNVEITSKIDVLKDMNKSSLRALNVSVETVKSIMSGNEVEKIDDFQQLQESYDEKLVALEHETNQKKKKLESLKVETSTLKANYENKQTNINGFNNELKQLKDNFNAIAEKYKDVYEEDLEIETYNKTLKFCEKSYKLDAEALKFNQSMYGFYERAIKHAEEEHVCMLCHIELPEEIKIGLLKRLKSMNSDLKNKTKIEDELKLKEKMIKRLSNFRKDVERINELKDGLIDNIQKESNDDKSNIDHFENEIINLDIDLNNKLMELNKWKSISNDISSIVRFNEELHERSRKIERFEESLSEQGLDVSNGELEKQYKEFSRILKQIRESLDILRSDRDIIQKQNNDLENGISELKLSINNLQMKSMDKVNIEKSIEETEIQIKNLQDNNNSTKMKIVSLKENYGQELVEYEKMKSTVSLTLDTIEKEYEKYNDIKREFNSVNEEIKNYEESGSLQTFESCAKEGVLIKSNIGEISKEIDNLNAALKELEANLSNSNNQERTIRYNIDLAKYEKELILIQEEMESLDYDKAKSQRAKYLKTSEELRELQISHQKQYAGKLGEVTQIEKQIEAIQSEINRDYKDVDSKYASEFAKLQTNLAMVTDLTTCYKATDNGVMEYHQLKMLKINNILDEIWKKTYMGNDVETIKIKADPIAAKKNLLATNNRSYNYRVVMVKNGTELDMRGRCSAGQKVLASIIIRIALAECFGQNFGMIALDEPTTNLDEENIESLAKALHTIIAERSSQRNFQLIIITHDEKFLRCMNAVDFTDHYFKVMRNERLNSTINKVRITSITE